MEHLTERAGQTAESPALTAATKTGRLPEGRRSHQVNRRSQGSLLYLIILIITIITGLVWTLFLVSRCCAGFYAARSTVPGVCHTVTTDFGHGGCTFRYPNSAVTIRTFQSDRRHLRCRHCLADRAGEPFLLRRAVMSRVLTECEGTCVSNQKNAQSRIITFD